ncbi:hypothetical protein HZC32_00165, partial [Candidatus Woesearchaeota archaeon]|nr:hypothetical protein [Candidatus Woesearchaeota archaeon]
MATKIYFKKGNEKIPFPEFLKEEKKKYGSWSKLDELCGIKRVFAYALNTTKKGPNNPSQDSFSRIRQGLGYSKEDFEFHNLRHHEVCRNISKQDPVEYNTTLRKIGDFILERNKNEVSKKWRFSSTIIIRIGGSIFSGKYGRNVQAREQLYQELLKLDDKYKSIELQRQFQSKPEELFPLRVFDDGSSEEDIIIETLLKYIEDCDISKRLPCGTLSEVRKKLNSFLKEKNLPERSKPSLRHHFRKIWHNKTDFITLTEGSPEPSPMERVEREYSLREAVRKLKVDEEKLKETALGEIAKEIRERRKENYDLTVFGNIEAIEIWHQNHPLKCEQLDKKAAFLSKLKQNYSARHSFTKRESDVAIMIMREYCSLVHRKLQDYDHPNKTLWRERWLDFIK